MIKIIDPKDCCGCTACASICAHDAITMEPDALGFLYPKVDESKCVDCGLCEKVCQFNDNYDRSHNLEQPIAFAARHKDIDEVMKSRSGAAFVAISDYILEQGGVVYGAGYKDHFRVAHKRATTKEERDEFRGSKYVQSDLTGVFRQVKEDLRNGLTVLFSGTPCQTAGLNAYVGKKLRENLFLVDIICHGTPSPYVWRDYLEYIEKKNRSKAIEVSFRDKRDGWFARHQEMFRLEDGRIVVDIIHRYLFYQSLSIRESCGACKFTNYKRPSDITIGDFWGYEKSAQELNTDNKGISLVFANSEKGKDLWHRISLSVICKNVAIKDTWQPNLEHPTEINSSFPRFRSDYSKKGFRYVIRRYGTKGIEYKMRCWENKIKRIYKRVFA